MADLSVLPNVRLFVSAALAPEVDVVLEPRHAHYLLRVMRLSQGERVRLFNGRDGEWLGFLATSGRAAATIRLERQTRVQQEEEGPWLAFSPVKKSATDFVVEKATELGSARLLPVIAERTIAHRVNIKRLLAVATEAAEQSGRLSVPDLAVPAALPLLAKAWPPQRALLIAHPHAQGTPVPLLDAMTELCRSAAPLAPMPPGLLIGPEGGFTPAELNGLAGLPCAKVVSLGPRTLRAETAAVAALACWEALAEARRTTAQTF